MVKKSWLRSRIVWAALATLTISLISLLGLLPVGLARAIDLATMVLAVLTVYFRFTTKVDVTMDPEVLRR